MPFDSTHAKSLQPSGHSAADPSPFRHDMERPPHPAIAASLPHKPHGKHAFEPPDQTHDSNLGLTDRDTTIVNGKQSRLAHSTCASAGASTASSAYAGFRLGSISIDFRPYGFSMGKTLCTDIPPVLPRNAQQQQLVSGRHTAEICEKLDLCAQPWSRSARGKKVIAIQSHICRMPICLFVFYGLPGEWLVSSSWTHTFTERHVESCASCQTACRPLMRAFCATKLAKFGCQHPSCSGGGLWLAHLCCLLAY